jgi:multiple sugar transport system permease protein
MMALQAQEKATRTVIPPRRRSWSRYSTRTFYLFIAPWFVLGFIGLTAIPLLYAFLVSFTNFDGMSGHWRWLGLDNYAELIGDPDTWYSLGRTFLYTVVSVPLSVGGGLGLALLLNRRLRAVGLYRTIFYVPSVVPVVASAVMWKIMFDRDAGIINALIELFGGPAITWLLDPTAFTVLVIMTLWGLGGGMVIFLAGLQGIPGELREAASVDGANAVQTFRAVVLPLLTPVVLFQVVTGVIAALQTLVQPLLLAESGGTAAVADVPRSNFLYMVNVYQQFFANQRFGYGAALLWVLFAVLLLITVLVLRSSTLWVYYEVDQGKGG